MVKQDNEVSGLRTPNILSHALVLFHFLKGLICVGST